MNFWKFFATASWWGKILGGFFGYLIEGSLGAFIGVLIGNFFDRGLANHLSNPHLLYHLEKHKAVQKIFFEATFSVIGHIAKSDGRVSEQEINMARVLMNEMRLNQEQKAQAKHFFNKGKHSGFNLSNVLTELEDICKDKRELLKLFVDIQYRVAQVDGLTPKKINLLDTIFSHLHFAPLHKQHRFHEDFSYTHQYQQRHNQNKSYSSHNQHHYQRPNNALAQAYALIEVTPDTSKHDVKRAYRRLLSQNHPDKLIAQGLPKEMIKLANEKTHNIVNAYQLICTSKGW